MLIDHSTLYESPTYWRIWIEIQLSTEPHEEYYVRLYLNDENNCFTVFVEKYYSDNYEAYKFSY
jgi:hypothetical protein